MTISNLEPEFATGGAATRGGGPRATSIVTLASICCRYPHRPVVRDAIEVRDRLNASVFVRL